MPPMNLVIYQRDALDRWKQLFDGLPDHEKELYADPRYICYIADNYGYIPEMAFFGNEDSYIFYPYYKRPLRQLAFYQECGLTDDLYDIVASWYYGGAYFRAHSEEEKQQLADRFVEAFHQYCANNRILAEFLRYDPNHDNHRPFEATLPVVANRDTIYVDVTQSEQEIWKDFRDGCQRSIKKAQQHFIVEETRRPEDIRTFFEIYDGEMVIKNAPPHLYFSHEFFVKGFETFKEFVLLAARHEGKMVGGFMIAAAHGIAHHYLSASLRDYWDYRVNNILFYEAIMWAKRHQHHIFDFQGGEGGVDRFKRNFSSTTRTFHIAKVVHHEELYRAMCEQHQAYYTRQGKSFEGSSEFFPQYRLFEG